jgi:hypothetical protein
MSQTLSEPRAFSVRARHLEGHDGHLVTETSFEAAAVASLESLALPAGGEGDISLIVREVESGREHCFRLDLETGEAAPCD